MSGLTTEQFIKARSARQDHLVKTFAVMFFAVIGDMYLILSYGPLLGSSGKAGMAVLVVTVAVYSILAVKAILDELEAMRRDIPESLAGSEYASHIAQIPVGLFRTLTITLNLAIALTQLWAIFSF